jgi:hypothetical protein
MASATTFRNKAETCRSLMRYVRNEQTLRVLNAMISENMAKALEAERLALHEGPSSPPAGWHLSRAAQRLQWHLVGQVLIDPDSQAFDEINMALCGLALKATPFFMGNEGGS